MIIIKISKQLHRSKTSWTWAVCLIRNCNFSTVRVRCKERKCLSLLFSMISIVQKQKWVFLLNHYIRTTCCFILDFIKWGSSGSPKKLFPQRYVWGKIFKGDRKPRVRLSKLVKYDILQSLSYRASLKRKFTSEHISHKN